MSIYKTLCVLCGVFLFAFAVHAQEATETPDDANSEDCAVIVQSALDLTQISCDETGLNQACYGHLLMEAQPRIGVTEFNFNEPGDTVGVAEVQSLRLGAMDVDTGQWGVMMIDIAAILAEGETVTSEDVQLLLFGEVGVEDATQFMWVTSLTDVNVRRYPRDNNSAVIASLPPGERVVASQRLEDNTWLRVRLPDLQEGEQLGWLSAELVSPEGDVESLEAVSLDEALSATPDEQAVDYGSMQAFYFQSGDDSPCAEAPNGLLIQTPEGMGSVTLWMDEVVIQLDATAFVQAQPNGALTVSVLDGSAQIESDGETRTATEGTQISVPLDENLAAAGAPSDPTPYEMETVTSLPVELLDDPVTIASPVEQIPLDGNWLFSWDVDTMTCPDGTVIPFESDGLTGEIRVQADGLTWHGTYYTEVSQGVYTAAYDDGVGNLHQDSLQVIAGDRIEGEQIIDFVNPICTLHVPFRIQLLSAF